MNPMLLLIIGLVAAPCPAAEGRFGAGAGPTGGIDGETSAVLALSWLGTARHPWELSAGYIARRERLAPAPAPVTLYVAVSRRLQWRRWFLSGGVALIDRQSDVLSGHGQFYTGAGYQARSWSISVRHLSNGDTGGRNRGETFLLVEYRP